jgi:hypothetical protein
MPVFDDEEDTLDQYIHEDADEIDTSYDLSKSKHVDKIRRVAVECMDHFFCDKTYWAGGKIPKAKLYKEEHIRVVMEMNIMDAFALAYYCLEHNKPDTVNTQDKGWEVRLCYEALDQCRNRWIPKCHIGGMILVFISVCHGVDFLPTLKKLTEIKVMIAKRENEAELRQLMKEQQEDDENHHVEREEIDCQ